MVMGLAYWAYNENYTTQASLKDVRSLHREIGAAHERLNVLEAEWAYLNRPDRLRDLARPKMSVCAMKMIVTARVCGPRGDCS